MPGNFTSKPGMMWKFTSARSVQSIRNGSHLFRNRRTMWQMIREVLSGQYRMSGLTVVVTVVAIAYIVFPFDIIPDFIPVLGWTDDGLVVYLVLKRLVKETQRFNRFKALERKGN